MLHVHYRMRDAEVLIVDLFLFLLLLLAHLSSRAPKTFLQAGSPQCAQAAQELLPLPKNSILPKLVI